MKDRGIQRNREMRLFTAAFLCLVGLSDALNVGSGRAASRRVKCATMVESWYDSGKRLTGDDTDSASPPAEPASYVPPPSSGLGKASDAAIDGALQFGPAIIGVGVILGIVLPGAGKFLGIVAENADLYSPMVDPSSLPMQ